MSEVVTLDRLREERYARVICYPKPSSEEIERRIQEIMSLGVATIEFTGESTILDVAILGKGYVGVVVLAHTRMGKAALKTRRTDADRAGMMHEAKMLQVANSVNVGPKLLDSSENFLVMEYVEGMLLPKWIGNVVQKGETSRIRKVLRDIMEQCWRLDELRLDHGELSRASKHIKVNPEDKAYILDFETASINRRVSNVTSICQYLFLQSEISEAVKEATNKVERESLIRALRIYKTDRSRERFSQILKTCGVISL